MPFSFNINPQPKVRMTGRSKWSDRARKCLEYQKALGNLARVKKVPRFGKEKVGFNLIHFYRFGRVCDLDNLEKAFFDGLQYGNVIDNDSQIIAKDNVRVYYVDSVEVARIEFKIYEYNDLPK